MARLSNIKTAKATERKTRPMNAADAGGGWPIVSVIVPVYNDPAGIGATLDAVLEQSYPADRYEVIVADNNSTDETRDVVRSYCEQHPELVTLVVEDQIQGPAAARNSGIEHASGSVFAFIDADMTVDETWLESVVTSLSKDDRSYMGCTVETYVPEGRETLAAKYDRLFAFPMQEYIEKSKFAGTGCLVVRREVFETVGLFDSRLISAEDKEFGQRVHEAGFDQYFESGITMYHPARSSVIEQVKKSFRLGRGNRQLHETYPDRFDVGNPFRLRGYLPLKPQWFYSQLKADKTVSMHDIVGLYLLASMKKFVNSVGTLYEYVTEKTTETHHAQPRRNP